MVSLLIMRRHDDTGVNTGTLVAKPAGLVFVLLLLMASGGWR
ncbi:hypothetical protein [Alcanivorax sp.]|jgi:hypothetical protein|nr:hypothetical protein [Alcanivorax sp.]|tara:strand:- start:19 stop:144 length:126 start_codon:yes stop_codon:yes gene_type:complete